MALTLRHHVISIATVCVLTFFLGQGTCDSTCPNGITNITGQTRGELVYPSSGNYGINETKCWRIEVPERYVGIGIYTHYQELEECLNCDCDYLQITSNYLYLGSWSECGRITPNYQNYALQKQGQHSVRASRGRNIYIRLVTDDSVHYRGFNFSFIVRSYTEGRKSYLNASEDETITFGTPKFGIKNYPASFAWQWYLIVPEGRQVKITFDAFELEQSENCEKDYLEVREAYFRDPNRDPTDIRGEYGAIVAKPMCGSTKPSTIQSSGNMVWVQFKSDSNTTTTYKGFKASFTAGQGRLSISNPFWLLLISALLMFTKDSVF